MRWIRFSKSTVHCPQIMKEGWQCMIKILSIKNEGYFLGWGFIIVKKEIWKSSQFVRNLPKDIKGINEFIVKSFQLWLFDSINIKRLIKTTIMEIIRKGKLNKRKGARQEEGQCF